MVEALGRAAGRACSRSRRCGRGSGCRRSGSWSRRPSGGRSCRRSAARRRSRRSCRVARGSASVSARLSPSSQLAWRNSTSISSPPSCSCAHSRYSNEAGLKTTYGGNCIRIPPSLPVSRSGSSASWKRRKISARNSRGGRSMRPRSSTRRLLAQVGRELLELHRVARHHAEGLHVHDEALGRPLGPVLDHLPVGQAVVGRVRLDHVEALGVVAQPLLGALDAGRVEVARQRLVGPGAGPDPDRRGHGPIVLTQRPHPGTLGRKPHAKGGFLHLTAPSSSSGKIAATRRCNMGWKTIVVGIDESEASSTRSSVRPIWRRRPGSSSW